MDEHGNNVVADTTEVFTFHSNCMLQDTHSIRRCVRHVLENMIDRGHLRNMVAHFWSDGCGGQNKGRKSFRQYSELSVVLQLGIIANFAASHHFEGPWDTEGGREAAVVKRHLLNDRDVTEETSILDAGDNVRLLQRLMVNSGEPDSPIESNKMWRPNSAAVAQPHVKAVGKPKPKRQLRGRTEEEVNEDDTN